MYCLHVFVNRTIPFILYLRCSELTVWVHRLNVTSKIFFEKSDAKMHNICTVQLSTLI